MNLNNIKLLKENKIHGNSVLPLMMYSNILIKDIHDLILHWHDEVEIIYVEYGSGIFQVNLESFEVNSGDILIIQPGAIHSGESLKNNSLYCKTIVFNLDMLKSIVIDSTDLNFLIPLINKEFELSILINKNCSGYNDIILSLTSILKSYEAKLYAYQLEIKGLLFIFLSYLFSNNYFKKIELKDSLRNKKIERLKLVIDYIQLNYNKTLSIKDLSSIANYSEFHFIRFFREQTGFTCIQYINLIKLDIALKLLKESHMSITDISFEVGFENVSYFIRIFKKRYGLTPSKLRKSI